LPSLGLQHPADQSDQSGGGHVQHTAGLGHFGFQPLRFRFPFRHIFHLFIVPKHTFDAQAAFGHFSPTAGARAVRSPTW